MASYQLQWKRRCLSLLPWLLTVEEMQRHLELFALLMFSSRAAGFSSELWWFCMCFCIVLVLAAVYGIVFLQCLHIVFVLSVTLSPFLISTGKPKCCHTNDLNVAGGSSILISPSRCWHHNSWRDNFSPRREISSRFDLVTPLISNHGNE